MKITDFEKNFLGIDGGNDELTYTDIDRHIYG